MQREGEKGYYRWEHLQLATWWGGRGQALGPRTSAGAVLKLILVSGHRLWLNPS